MNEEGRQGIKQAGRQTWLQAGGVVGAESRQTGKQVGRQAAGVYMPAVTVGNAGQVSHCLTEGGSVAQPRRRSSVVASRR